MPDMRAFAASRMYARDYELVDETWLRCRRCSRRVEPSMSQIHLRSATCRHFSAKRRAAEMKLVPVPPLAIKHLDEVGLCVWLETNMDEDTGKVTFQAWVKPQILRYFRGQRNDPERRARRIERLSMMTPSELEKELR